MAQCASLIAPYTPKGMPAGQFKRKNRGERRPCAGGWTSNKLKDEPKPVVSTRSQSKS
jgi:hypothetical protein